MSRSPSVYPIAAVSKLTGVSCHALRAWERRYGFPVPNRSASGHRRYTEVQVELLRHLAHRVLGGEGVSQAIAAVTAGQAELLCEGAAYEAEESALLVMIQHLVRGEFGLAERHLRTLSHRLSPEAMIARVISPALVELGEMWFRGDLTLDEERLAASYLLQKLTVILDQARADNPHPHHRALLGCLPGERHEGGLLMLGVHLERKGWRVHILGGELPVSAFKSALSRWQCHALGVSFVLSRNITKRFAEISSIRGVPVFVGGRSVLNHQRLARQYGLIPLCGPVGVSANELRMRCEPRKEPGRFTIADPEAPLTADGEDVAWCETDPR